jgi:hypothetical protein
VVLDCFGGTPCRRGKPFRTFNLALPKDDLYCSTPSRGSTCISSAMNIVCRLTQRQVFSLSLKRITDPSLQVKWVLTTICLGFPALNEFKAESKSIWLHAPSLTYASMSCSIKTAAGSYQKVVQNALTVNAESPSVTPRSVRFCTL